MAVTKVRAGLGLALGVVLSFPLACGGETFSNDSDDGSGGSAGGGTGGGAGSGSGGVSATGGSSGVGGSSGEGGSAGEGASSGTGGGIGGAGSGGASGAGGAAGSGAMAGSGGVGGPPPPMCPPNIPAQGTPCEEGQHCNYEGCCPTFADCVSGKWQITQPPCLPPECPVAPPGETEGCECLEGFVCEYDQCLNAGIAIRTTCGTGPDPRWKRDEITCPSIDCGGIDCPTGYLCVQKSLGGPITQTCEINPCSAFEPPTCACASSLCPSMSMCTGVSMGIVQCECLACM